MIRQFLKPFVFVVSALSFSASVSAQAPTLNSHNQAVKVAPLHLLGHQPTVRILSRAIRPVAGWQRPATPTCLTSLKIEMAPGWRQL